MRVRSCPRVGLVVGSRNGKGGKKSSRLRIGSWNIWTLTGKSIELGKILQKRKISIACVQETRWKGIRARDADGFKLWYSGSARGKNGVGILVDRDLRELVVKVRRINNRFMSIKLVVGGFTVNMISAYSPQVGLDQEVKKQFWQDLDEMVRSIPHTEKLFIGGDFNGHIGASARGYDDVHGRYGFGDRNEEGNSLLDFARAFDLVIANSSFPKREEHLVTF
uniref:Craniofacial development protein 2-like n=1 Tax=Nicotiana tabacum TaxID=4097 RepID=A0A1S4A244_TOBAC|nr:PREDICTED: craniofacial development protein 2-like [Nicotiana tabacum]